MTTIANRELVARCCAQARTQGITPGMPLAEARALCPAGVRTRVAPFEPDRSRQALAMLAKWSLRFSPTVMVDPTPSSYYDDDTPDGLLLDVTGEAHLFGGEHLLLADVAARVAWLGFSTRLAIAPTLGAAWALARFGPHPLSVLDDDHLHEALAPLPVAALRLSAATIDQLAQVGIERVGHLLRLPRESLLTRYGEELLMRLDQAFGRISEQIDPLHPTEPVTVRRLFEGACVQLEAIFLATQGLLEELAHHLVLEENGARGIRVEWTRINAPPVSRDIFLGHPSRDPKHLWSLLRPKIEALHLGYGVEAITLTAFWTQRIIHRQLGAWDTGDADDTHDQHYAAFLDTLLNRWRTPSGAWQGGRMMAAKPVASHTPEVARTFETLHAEKTDHEISPLPSTHRQSAIGNGQSIPLLFLDRPTTLLDHPEPAQALALQPDHPPGLIVWRGREQVITKGLGPERIATAWWGKNTLSTRDYFKLQTTTGLWLWTFRELESNQWFVHGTWS